MRKLSALFLIMLLAAATMNAQFTKIGGGLAGGSGIAWNNEMDEKSHRTGYPAVRFDGIYEISVPLHLQPSFTVYMPRITKTSMGTFSERQIVSCMMFDADAHYVFNSLDKMEFYGLAGLNVTFIGMKWVTDYDGTVSKSKDTDNAFGLNIGAGTYFKLTEQFDIQGEIKYILGKYDQLLVNVGVLINLDWLIKHENTGL